MKLTFKDLKQQKFEIEAEPTDTIAKLKEKIAAEKSWEPSAQKLIYSGKILADDKTVADYKVEEKGFIVCMISKPKPTPSAASSSVSTPAKAPSTPAQAPKAPATPSAPAPAAPADLGPRRVASPAVPATPSPAGAGTSSGDPGLLMGAARESAISNMVEMGFERADIDNAMRAAFYNPDRAVEYLMNGIPEGLQPQNQASSSAPQPATTQSSTQPASAPAAGGESSADPENINLFEAAAAAAAGRGGAARPGGSSAGAGAGAAGGVPLDFLRNNPQFQQLRRLVQESPQMLEPILQQVGQGNPQLAALISQNPDAFLQLLSEGADGDDDGEALPPGGIPISVTQEEAEAIDRLCGLGFQREMVIQAYFACDKNEELTANYLFDNPELGDEMEG